MEQKTGKKRSVLKPHFPKLLTVLKDPGERIMDMESSTCGRVLRREEMEKNSQAKLLLCLAQPSMSFLLGRNGS